jgi:hypothetical protein
LRLKGGYSWIGDHKSPSGDLTRPFSDQDASAGSIPILSATHNLKSRVKRNTFGSTGLAIKTMSAVREQRATSFLISDIIILMVSKPLRSRLYSCIRLNCLG